MAEWIYFIHPPREKEDPVIAGGFARGELRPFRISLLRGRDPGDAQAGLSPEVEGHPPD